MSLRLFLSAAICGTSIFFNVHAASVTEGSAPDPCLLPVVIYCAQNCDVCAEPCLIETPSIGNGYVFSTDPTCTESKDLAGAGCADSCSDCLDYMPCFLKDKFEEKVEEVEMMVETEDAEMLQQRRARAPVASESTSSTTTTTEEPATDAPTSAPTATPTPTATPVTDAPISAPTATPATMTVRTTEYKLSCVPLPCTLLNRDENQAEACEKATEAVMEQAGDTDKSQYACATQCKETTATCSAARRERRAAAASADLSVYISTLATQDVTPTVNPSTAITLSFTDANDAAVAATSAMPTTKEFVLPVAVDTIKALETEFDVDALVTAFSAAPLCGVDVCCSATMCTAQFGVSNQCCTDETFCRSDASCNLGDLGLSGIITTFSSATTVAYATSALVFAAFAPMLA